MTLAKKRILLFLIPLALAAPFLNRAYFVDDHFFVEIARWIKDNPSKPYDFPVDGFAPDATLSKKDLSLRIVNPLLHHYYLAGLIAIGGEREWFLRLGCVLLSCFSALFIFELARRWLVAPFLATVLTLVTPVYWLTSYSLLIDSTMAFFFLMAVYSFVRAGEENSVRWHVMSGFAMGAAMLSKYTAVFLFPLSFAWLFFSWRKTARPWLFAIPVSIGALMLGGYVFVTQAIYGTGHLFAASGETLHGVSLGKMMVLFVFLSGGAIVPLVVWLASRRRTLLVAGSAVLLLGVFLGSSWGGFSLGQAALFSLWLVTGALVIAAFYVNRALWISASDRFLFVWLVGFLVMMTMVMQWVAVRYYVIAAPALVFICIRIVEVVRPQRAALILRGAVLVTFLTGLALAYADFQQAEASRFIVKALEEQHLLQGMNNYYFSDGFTMSYLAKEGWKPASNLALCAPGDRVLTTEVTLPLSWFRRHSVPMRLITSIECPSSFPIKLMDARDAAGFYASAWGPLPFMFSTGPWERFDLFEIIHE